MEINNQILKTTLERLSLNQKVDQLVTLMTVSSYADANLLYELFSCEIEPPLLRDLKQ